MEQSNQSKKVLLSVIGVAILVVAVVGVSFAFFNYTRTGAANTISTGKIYFNHTQSGTASLSNVFPLTAQQLEADTTKASHAEVEIAITADTTYTGGLEYRLVATSVDFTTNLGSGDVVVPVSVVVTDKNDTLNTHGTFISNYPLGNASSSVVSTGKVLATGTVAASPISGQGAYTGHNYSGTVVVKAYLDANRIAITDTLVGEEASGENYTNGTTGTGSGTWVNGRLRMTTAQWNSLTSQPLTFDIRVESIEAGGTYAYTDTVS